MSDYKVARVLDVKAELGECPLWSEAEQCLYWLDIVGSTLNRFDPQSGKNIHWSLPSVPGCFAFLGNGAVLIAAQDGMYELEFATSRIRLVFPLPHAMQQLRFNDGRTDRQGRLWVGTVQADMVSASSDTAYFRFDGQRLDKILSPVGMANGTAFSPDGKTMYRAQTTDRLIFAYDYDPDTGTPSRERLFATVPQDLGLPDGAAIDTEAAYWVALPAPPEGGTAGIARYTPDGELDIFIEVPVPMPTMVAFGGPGMSTLYVTSGRLQAWVRYHVPDTAGSLFAIETKFRGVPETPFRPA